MANIDFDKILYNPKYWEELGGLNTYSRKGALGELQAVIC